MFARLVGESFVRNPRRKILTAAALVVGMAVATATLTIALDAGDRLAREFRSLGANLLVGPQSDTLPVEIGGVDYRPVDEGAYLQEADLGKLKMIFWRHNILGFTPFLDVPTVLDSSNSHIETTVIGTWYDHEVPVPDGTHFRTGLKTTHPSWKITGKWFADNTKECVVGADLAAAHPDAIQVGKTIDIDSSIISQVKTPLVVTGLVSTGDAEDNAILVPLAVAQSDVGARRKIPPTFHKRSNETRGRPFRARPEVVDADRIRPLVLLAVHFVDQLSDRAGVTRHRRTGDPPRGRYRRAHPFARQHPAVDRHTRGADRGGAFAVAATSATTVLQRRAEIGIMKAIGATNALVGSIFLAEQLMLAFAGGAVGFVFWRAARAGPGGECIWFAGFAAAGSAAGRARIGRHRGSGGKPDPLAARGSF